MMGAPWTFTQINGLWRQVVITTPTLWGRMNISHDHMDWMVNPQSLLELMMERSGSMPLNIRYSRLGYQMKPTRTSMYMQLRSDAHYRIQLVASADEFSLAKVVVAHCRRWRIVDITGDSTLVDILNTIKGNIPELQRLSLTLRGDFSKLDAFIIAPNLRHLALGDASSVNSTMFPYFGLTQYQSTHFYQLRGRHFIDLQYLSNLVHCSLTGEGGMRRWINDEVPPYPGPPIQLPHLTALKIDEIAYLVMMTAPALKHLDISACGGALAVSSKKGMPLLSFVNRSSCELESFRLWAGDCTGGSDIMRHLPTLKLVHADSITYSGFRTILTTHHFDRENFLPCLQEFMMNDRISDGGLHELKLNFPGTTWTRYTAYARQPSTLKITFSPPSGDILERNLWDKNKKLVIHRRDRTVVAPEEMYPAGLSPDTEWPMIGNGFWGYFPSAAHEDLSVRATKDRSRPHRIA